MKMVFVVLKKRKNFDKVKGDKVVDRRSILSHSLLTRRKLLQSKISERRMAQGKQQTVFAPSIRLFMSSLRPKTNKNNQRQTSDKICDSLEIASKTWCSVSRFAIELTVSNDFKEAMKTHSFNFFEILYVVHSMLMLQRFFYFFTFRRLTICEIMSGGILCLPFKFSIFTLCGHQTSIRLRFSLVLSLGKVQMIFPTFFALFQRGKKTKRKEAKKLI